MNVNEEGSKNVTIGASPDSVNRKFFSGSIDDVRIYNRSLSSSEIYQIYASNLYKFNSTQWYLLVNQSQNISTALISGSYTYYAAATDNSGNKNMTLIQQVNVVGPPSAKRFIITNSSNDNVASLDDKGDMYLRGIVVQSQTSLSPTNNSFIVTNSSNDPVCYINNTGSILLLGTITETSTSGATTTNLEIHNSSGDSVAFFNNTGD